MKLKPLFTQKCLACHGDDPNDIAAAFDMRTRASLLRGGESFGDAVVLHGQGSDSYLYRVTTREEEGYEMPPKESERLSEEQTWWIRDWIDDGAPWPDDDRIAAIIEEYAEGERVVTSGGWGRTGRIAATGRKTCGPIGRCSFPHRPTTCILWTGF